MNAPSPGVSSGRLSPAGWPAALKLAWQRWRRGPAPLAHLPAPARRFMWLVIPAGWAWVALLLVRAPEALPGLVDDNARLAGALALFLLNVALGTLVVHLSAQRQASAGTVAAFAQVLLLPAGPAALLVLLATLLASMLRRRAWYNAAFNASQGALAAGSAGLIHDLMTSHLPAADWLSPLLPAGTIVAVALVHVGMSCLLTGGIIAARDHRPLPTVWVEVLREAAWVETGWIGAGAALFGLASVDVGLTPLALIPVWTIYRMGGELSVATRRVWRLETGVAAQARFVQDAAHEIRSPLTALRGNLDLLAANGGMAETDRRQLLEDVRSQARRLSTLATDLLLLARLDGTPARARVAVDVVELVAEAASSLRQRSNNGVFLELDLADEASVRGDPDQLQRVFVNLIENALRHTPAGGRVRVSVGGDREWVVAEVADTGEGIDPSDLTRVFERFYRGRAMPPRGPGSGLGLAIVREIVVAHGGQITVDSQPGHGARFVVRLPIAS